MLNANYNKTAEKFGHSFKRYWIDDVTTGGRTDHSVPRAIVFSRIQRRLLL
jgi:hypothetical protein